MAADDEFVEHPCEECGEATYNPRICRDCRIEYQLAKLDKKRCPNCLQLRWTSADALASPRTNEIITAWRVFLWGNTCSCAEKLTK
jgi:hypothetical protein